MQGIERFEGIHTIEEYRRLAESTAEHLLVG